MSDERPLLYRREFVIRDRDGSGETDLGVVFTGEIRVLRRLANRFNRGSARLQRLEVENRPHHQERSLVGFRQGLVAGQFLPGEGRRLVCGHLLDGLGDQIQRPRHGISRILAPLRPGQAELQHTSQAAQTGVIHQNIEERGCGGQLAGLLGDLGGRQEQKSVIIEERPATRTPDPNEPIGLWEQLLLKSGGRLTGEFRGWSLHNGQNAVISAGKRLLEVNFALSPVEIRRNQRRNVGIDGEVPVGIDACSCCQSYAG